MISKSDKIIIKQMILRQQKATPGIVNQYKHFRYDNQEQIFRSEIVCSNKDDGINPVGVGTETVAT